MNFRSFLVLTLLLIVFFCGTSTVFAATHTVNPTQNNNVIQNILDHANPGDIIQFLNGNYYHIELAIRKTLTLISQGSVTLNGNGIPSNDSIIKIATSVNNAMIQGFTLKNGYFGVENNGTCTKIINNTFTQNWDGVLTRGNQANITQNRFINESWDGIVSYGDNLIIENNTIINHPYIGVYSTGDNVLAQNNYVADGKYGINSYGSHSTINNNTIENMSVWGIRTGDDSQINNNTIKNTNRSIISGNNNTVTQNNINNSTEGISSGQYTSIHKNNITNTITAIKTTTAYNNIKQNIITNNTQGILITGLYNIIENNSLQKNQVALISTSTSTIQNNNITDNNQGIIITGNWNTILHNYLENNINALNILGNWTQVQENTLTSNQNGINITEDNNTFWLNLIENSTQGIIINGNNNFLLQNTIQNNLDGIINNAAQNILNYNRITNQVNNLINQNNHHINANYNWWGENNPTKIIGNNVNTTNYVIGQININNTTIEMDTLYNITIKLTDHLGNNLTSDIPSFPIKFQFDGDIYPNQTTIFHNQAQTQIQVFNEGNYTLTAQLDQETLTLTLKTPDITPPTIQAQITPPISSSGKNITINTTSDADTEKITAQIMGTVYYLTQNIAGDWFLNYTIPSVTDGIYNIFLQATDYTGNIGNQTLNFTVDNTPPLINATTTPNITSSGSNVIIKALSSNDTVNVTAQILENSYDLVFSGGEWVLDYVIPEITDGIINILLTATDQAGNTAQNTTNFTVDNTLPQLLASVNPNFTKTDQIIQIKTNTDTGVTNLTAEIEGTIYNLINNGNGTWILNYTVPQLKDGFHNILLTAIDQVGNTGTGWTGFNIDNTPPHINPTITIKNNQIYLKTLSDPDTVKITVQIDGKTYNLQSQGNNTWTLNNPITLKNGEYNLLFNAEDQLQNQAQLIKKITIQEHHTPINHTTIPDMAVGSITKTMGISVSEGKSTSAMVFMGNNAQGTNINNILLNSNLKTDYGVLLSHPKYQEALKKFEQMSPSQKQDVLDKLQSNLKVDPNKENAFQALEKYLKENPWAVYLLTALAIAGLILITGGTGAIIGLLPFLGESTTITTLETTELVIATETGTGIGIGITEWIIQRLPQSLQPGFRTIFSLVSRVSVSSYDMFSKLFPVFRGDVPGISQVIFESVAPYLPSSVRFGALSVIRNPLYIGFSGQLSAYETLEFIKNPQDNIITPIYNYAKSAVKPFVSKIQKQIATIKKKGPVKYIKEKAKTIYNKFKKKIKTYKKVYKTKIKPKIKKYVKPIVRKIVSPIVRSKPYKALKKIPIIKQGLNKLGKLAKKIGIW